MPRQNRTSYNDHLTCLNRYPLREIFQILLQSFTDQEQTALDNLYAQTMTEGEEGNRFETIYDLKELYKVINAVPEDLKKPFMMFVAGFKYREIAEKMDLPVGTIRRRLFLIRQSLQQE